MVEELVTERLSAAPGDADNPHAWARSGSLPFARFFTGHSALRLGSLEAKGPAVFSPVAMSGVLTWYSCRSLQDGDKLTEKHTISVVVLSDRFDRLESASWGQNGRPTKKGLLILSLGAETHTKRDRRRPGSTSEHEKPGTFGNRKQNIPAQWLQSLFLSKLRI